MCWLVWATAVAIDGTGTAPATRRFVVNAGTPAALARWTSRWDLRRFAIPTADHVASYTSAAPLDASSGEQYATVSSPSATGD
jgi:hypothetical protein